MESLVALATVLNYNINQSLKALDVSRPIVFSIEEETTGHFARMLKVTFVSDQHTKACSGLSLFSDHNSYKTRSSAVAEGLHDALVSIEKSWQSMNDLHIHPRLSHLLPLNERTANHFLFADCCFNVYLGQFPRHF